MKEEDKYYVPSIEEFHVGFEYEEFSNRNEWFKNDFGDSNGEFNNELTECNWNINRNKLRVKYLDKEDIESLGWIFEKQHPGLNDMTFSHSNREIMLEFEDFNDILPFNVRIWEGDCMNEINYFNGKIKNKSELIKLMKQLGI